MGKLSTCFGVTVTIFAIFVGFFWSGTAKKLGLFAKLTELDSQAIGLTPSFVDMDENTFSCSKLPNLSGKVALITGANNGLGFSNAKILARCAQMKVYMACRDVAKCKTAAKRIVDETGVPSSRVIPVQVDLASLKSVAAFADSFQQQESRLDALIFNAGISAGLYGLTEDGIEQIFAVNHLSHFLLWKRLRGMVEKTAETYGDARLVSVSSASLYSTFPNGVHLTLEGINDMEAHGHGWLPYGQSKLANWLFIKEVAEREAGNKVYANALHPGLVRTNIAHDNAIKFVEKFVEKMPFKEVIGDIVLTVGKFLIEGFRLTVVGFGWDSDQAALTQSYLAASDEVVTNNIRGKFLHPITTINDRLPDYAYNVSLQKGLWEFSESLLAERGF